MEPPPDKAPPLSHLARHLRQSFETVDAAVGHVVSYAPAPEAARSILPERAVERFGLMPPQPLPAPMLEAAARYIWTLSNDGDVERPMDMEMRRGRGGGDAPGMGMMQMRGGQDGERPRGMMRQDGERPGAMMRENRDRSACSMGGTNRRSRVGGR